MNENVAGYCFGDWLATSNACGQCVWQNKCSVVTINGKKGEVKKTKYCWGNWDEKDITCEKCTICQECMGETTNNSGTVKKPLVQTPFEYFLNTLRNKFDEQKVGKDNKNILLYLKNDKLVVGVQVGQNGTILIETEKGKLKIENLESKEQVDGILERLT